ncbi:MAG: NADH:flavin oxidoreductase [Planctomycetes bacterium]|nr:NADH:flavin oxidoreductase [Planctomycetota bacterium]NOG54429.1 NADH:flavin oxidoreductase [Planctomycetota bacterium]
MTNPLLVPLTFRNGRSARNRVWLAPMTNMSSHADGTLSDDELAFLAARAEGGFGIVETCAAHVTRDGQGWAGALAMFDDTHRAGWQRLAQEVHAHGSLLIGQAYHGGSRAYRSADHPVPWSCSPAAPDEPEVRQATPDLIESTIQAFADAARRLESVGVDGIELHGAHGYLLCQFLSSVLNQRSDEWGGSLKNRARLVRRVLQASRAAVSDDFILGVRLSPESSSSLPGLDLDETLQVASWLCDDGADFIHISLWHAENNSAKRPDEHPARIFRDALPHDVPLITAGNIWTMEDAMAQLDYGADAVALGRAAIANPDWPGRVIEQGFDPSRPPLTARELQERALGSVFIDYMRKWSDFVAD